MLDALDSGHPADFEAIPLGGARKLTNPQAGLAFDTEGNDPHQFAQPAPPAFASAWEAGEAAGKGNLDPPPSCLRYLLTPTIPGSI